MDEPTSGLDPDSRRQIWSILLKLRQDHSILLTTHHMEDAEALADRVLIMADGKILSEGTLQELKIQHGSGYMLKLMCETKVNVETLMLTIQQFILGARIKVFFFKWSVYKWFWGYSFIHLQSFAPPTVCVTLPYDDMHKYPELFLALENQMLKLGILTISIANTTMEDVFLK